MTERPYTRRVFYSVTSDNPFLPAWYREQLENDLDPRTAQRMIHGRWIRIEGESIYHAYRRANNYSKETYEIQSKYPIWCSWDFNIGEGKPLSVCVFQFIEDHMYIFDEVVIQGLRTEDSCEELEAKGYLTGKYKIMVTGDQTGTRRDTRSRKSDYDIIKKYLSNVNSGMKDARPLNWEMKVPSSNSPVRERHNLVNGYCENVLGDHRMTIYSSAPMADKALTHTKLKPNAGVIEDDSKDYQHIGTSIGYGLRMAKRDARRLEGGPTLRR